MADEIKTGMHPDSETERLGRALARKAEERGGFIAGAFALWQRVNPQKSITAELGIGDEARWRLAVCPFPPVERLGSDALRLANEYGANPKALLSILRMSATAAVFRSAEDTAGMLKAALDDEDKD